MKKKLVPLLVTTGHKGVFFGWGVESDAPTIRLEKAQMCVYWSADLVGLFKEETMSEKGSASGLILGRYVDESVICTCQCGTRLVVKPVQIIGRGHKSKIRLMFAAPRERMTIMRDDAKVKTAPTGQAIETIWGDVQAEPEVA